MPLSELTDEPLVSDEKEAAHLLGLSVFTLRNWRHLRRGPVYVKRGRSVAYLRSDLVDYLQRGRIDPEARK